MAQRVVLPLAEHEPVVGDEHRVDRPLPASHEPGPWLDLNPRHPVGGVAQCLLGQVLYRPDGLGRDTAEDLFLHSVSDAAREQVGGQRWRRSPVDPPPLAT